MKNEGEVGSIHSGEIGIGMRRGMIGEKMGGGGGEDKTE